MSWVLLLLVDDAGSVKKGNGYSFTACPRAPRPSVGPFKMTEGSCWMAQWKLMGKIDEKWDLGPCVFCWAWTTGALKNRLSSGRKADPELIVVLLIVRRSRDLLSTSQKGATGISRLPPPFLFPKVIPGSTSATSFRFLETGSTESKLPSIRILPGYFYNQLCERKAPADFLLTVQFSSSPSTKTFGSVGDWRVSETVVMKSIYNQLSLWISYHK